MDEAPSRARLRAAAFVVLPVVAFVVLAALPFPVCQSRLLFGAPCPGCGLTRATNALLHLHVGESLRLHPLALPVLGYIAVELGRSVLKTLGRPPSSALEAVASQPVRLGLAAALVVLFVVRLGGGLGGLPDPVDVRSGLVGRGVGWVTEAAVTIAR